MQPYRLGFRLWAPMPVIGFLTVFAGSALAAPPTVTSFSPASGTIGTKITIAGSGFAKTKTVAIGGAASAFKAMSNTRIVATAPADVVTGTIAVTTTGGTGRSKAIFTVTPGVALSAATGEPRSVLQISGAGFRPGTAVDIYFDTIDEALAITTSKGLIAMQLQVPASAQPGTHWVSLVARGSFVAAQTAFVVDTNWLMMGFSLPGRSYNVFENTVGISNVSSLTDAWSKPSGGFANPSPFVVSNGNVFVGDVNGAIHAYSNAGALLWMASPGSSLQSVTPVALRGRVFFGAANGNVYAYSAGCRRDGGICTPLWTKSVGTSVTGSLKFQGTQLYVPSSDGSIHLLDALTGAAGTPIFGIDTTHGAVTTPITFTGDGTFYYGAGTAFEYRTSNGSAGVSPKGGTVSPIAAGSGVAYFTTGDGKINEFGGAGWSAATSGTNCAPAPAVANNLVYAGGCTTLAAFEAGRGTLRWSITTAGPVFGLSVANGVLYGCIGTGAGFGGTLFAFDASFGGLLWSGGQCIGGGPIITNGTVYAAFANVTAYKLPGQTPNRVVLAPRTLHPDFRLLPGRSRISPVTGAE